MTQREKVTNEIKSILDVYNNLATANGFEPMVYGSYYTRDAKVYELKQTLENFKRNLNELNVKIKVKQYYLTDEGAAKKATLDKELEYLYNESESEYETYKAKISEMILSRLDENWTCNITNSGGSFGLIDKINNDRYIFGHSCELYFDNWFRTDPKLQLNYGALGAFNPLDENTHRAEYLMGMAKIATDKELFTELTTMYIEWNKSYYKRCRKIDDVKKLIKNPFAA